MNAEQKQRIAHEISNWRNARNDHSSQITGDRMADLLQELVDAPETEPVARVTGYYAGYLSIATVDGRVLPAGTALYAAQPAPSVPDMPLSMEQFGGLVGLARDDASEKAIVYKATNIYGETCYFGVKSTAQAWAKSGSVDEVRLRELRVVAAPTPAEAPADVARDAWYGSNPPSLVQATAIYMALLEAAKNQQKLSDERILELFYEHATPDRWPFGFARAIGAAMREKGQS